MIAAIARATTRPPAEVELAAELRDVRKSFGRAEALRGVSLGVRPGEIVALLGPNGAGKTTALRILLGLRRPDSGRALLFGSDPARPAARARCGCTPQETSFPATLKVSEIVDLVRAHYAQPAPAGALLDRYGLAGLARRQTGGLSGGERRRLAVALAFAGAPELAILDEPSSGLDVESRRLLWDGVREYAAAGGTVLLTTHYLEEAEALASEVVVISHGVVLARGSVDDIRARAGLTRIRIRASAVPSVPGVLRREERPEVTTLYARDAGAVVRRLVEAGAALDGLEVAPVTLEEAFVLLTREAR